MDLTAWSDRRISWALVGTIVAMMVLSGAAGWLAGDGQWFAAAAAFGAAQGFRVMFSALSRVRHEREFALLRHLLDQLEQTIKTNP